MLLLLLLFFFCGSCCCCQYSCFSRLCIQKQRPLYLFLPMQEMLEVTQRTNATKEIIVPKAPRVRSIVQKELSTKTNCRVTSQHAIRVYEVSQIPCPKGTFNEKKLSRNISATTHVYEVIAQYLSVISVYTR